MNARIFQLFSRSSVTLLSLLLITSAAYGQAFPRPPRDAGPKPKNVHGVVQDARGNRVGAQHPEHAFDRPIQEQLHHHQYEEREPQSSAAHEK